MRGPALPLLVCLLTLQPFATRQGVVGAVVQVGDDLLPVVHEVEDIAATGDIGQGEFLAGAEAGAEVGDGGVGGEAAVGQFQEPHAPGVGVAVLLLAEQVTERGGGIDAHEDRPSGLKDLVMGADADAGQVVRPVDLLGPRDGRVDDVVDGPQGELGVEEVAQKRDHAAVRTVADQDQREDQLTEPGLGDRQVEQDLIGRPLRVEGGSEGVLGGVGLLVEELAADLMLPRQVGDGRCAGEDRDGQVLPLLGRELLGRAGAGAGSGIVSDCVAETKQIV